MIPTSAQGATKLLEALEKLSRWAGDPPGDRPSGVPAGELVRAFEEALSSSPAEHAVSRAGEGSVAAPVEAAPLPGPAEVMPSPAVAGTPVTGDIPPSAQAGGVPDVGSSGGGTADAPVARMVPEPQAVFRGEGLSRQDILDELGRLLERISGQGALVGPQELLRVQQLVGMLNVQAKVGIQTSQQATQGLESLLRQSG